MNLYFYKNLFLACFVSLLIVFVSLIRVSDVRHNHSIRQFLSPPHMYFLW